MKLSVIIPCFNAANTIAVQLEALAHQHWCEPWEVIVSNNGSTDETVAIEQYQENLSNLRIVDSSDQRGAAHARNVGILAAAGDALAFCDADDEVGLGWVMAIGEALSKYDFVACKREYNKLNEPGNIASSPSMDFKNKYPSHRVWQYPCDAQSMNLSVDSTKLCSNSKTPTIAENSTCRHKLHFLPDVVPYRLRDKVEDLYDQARLWGKYNVLLYKKYRPLGMPKLSNKSEGLVRLLKSFQKSFPRKIDILGWKFAER